MSAFATHPGGESRWAKSKLSRKLNHIISKYPTYGKILSDRQRFNNPPKLITIGVGGDAWRRAKNWQKHPDFAALVLTHETPPDQLIWPVFGSTCLIEWGVSAPEALIIELVSCLLSSGASLVAVMPMWGGRSRYTNSLF